MGQTPGRQGQENEQIKKLRKFYVEFDPNYELNPELLQLKSCKIAPKSGCEAVQRPKTAFLFYFLDFG